MADNNLNSLIAVIQKEREARKEITKDLTRLPGRGLKTAPSRGGLGGAYRSVRGRDDELNHRVAVGRVTCRRQ